MERTVELAQSRSGMSSCSLRAALNSSPLWGVGRVEDTYNLLGHALKKALSMIARPQGRGLTEVAIGHNLHVIARTSTQLICLKLSGSSSALDRSRFMSPAYRE